MSAGLRPSWLRRVLTRVALSSFRVPRDAIRFGFRRYRSRVAVIHGENRLTFAALEERVGRLVGALSARGLHRGDLVLACFDDGPDLLVVRFAALELGIRLAMVAPWVSPSSVATYGQLGPPKMLLLDQRLDSTLKDALRSLSTEVLETGPSWDALLANSDPMHSAEKLAPADIALVGFTSGTTGVPKVIATPHAALLKSLTLTATNVRTPVGQQEVMMTGIPLNGAGSGLILPMALTGATLVIPTSRQPNDLLQLMRAHSVSRVFFTPSQLIDLLEEPDFSRERLPALRNVIYGSAAMPVPRLEDLLARLGPILQQGYGMAEVLPPVSLLQMEQHVTPQGPASREVLRSVGWVVPEVEVRVVDGQLKDVAKGELGEVLVKSPTLFEGYWKLEGVDRSVFHEGFLRTGDVGTLRADGLLTVLDRRPDRLTINGTEFSARLLEEAVYAHRPVKEACIVQPAPNAPATVFVSPRRGGRIDPRQVEQLLEDAGVKGPTVRVLDELPRSPLQKVLRRDLRALVT